jgi:hypothetical protein
MIPYVISEAHPDYKRPWLSQDFGVVKEEETQTYFLDKICEFILDRIYIDSLECQDDIESFFDSYYDEYYMSNSPWDTMVFINGEWENMTPSNEKIWEHIQLLKLQEKEDEEEKQQQKEVPEKEEEQQKEEHDILDENDKLILTNIKVYFEKMLEEKPLTSEQIQNLQQMNQIQQLTSLFTIYMTDESYTKNENLFKEFLNLCLKFLQKDIELITKKMETEESNELSKQLEHALEVYSNTLLVKQTFNI